jgi:hypothetical protein
LSKTKTLKAAKLDEDRKLALDRFLASLVEGGIKVSLQEMLGLIVAIRLRTKTNLLSGLIGCLYSKMIQMSPCSGIKG